MILALVANLFRLLFYPLMVLRRRRAAPKGAYVAIEIDGPVADFLKPSARLFFARRAGRAPVSVARVRQLARTLAEDPSPAGVFLHVKSLTAGPAVLASLRDAISEIRASGKDVVAYLPQGGDNRVLFLASAARLVVVGPETMVAPLGYAVEGRYVRRALERVGVEPEVFAKGAYKSAGEMFVRDDMSEAQREQVGALLEARHDALVGALAQGRRVERDVARRWIDEAPHRAVAAVELGIVDAVAYEDELARALAPVGEKDTYRLRTVDADAYLKARLATRFAPLRPRAAIGVIEVHGPIVGAPRFALSNLASEERIISAVRAAREARSIKGVVLHIDSPGGSAIASDRIYHEVTRLAEMKPVVAYMSNVAASGGYYVAAGAHSIVAQPQTVTGSIGVVTARFVVTPLLERLGVFTDVVKRGAHADMFSTTRRFDDVERAVFERELDAFYQTFLAAVAKGRKKPVEAIEPLAQGRVYSGTDAHARGLVDRLGGFELAMHEVREMLGPNGKGLEAALVKAPRTMPPAPRLPAPVATILDSFGLGTALEAAQIALDSRGDRVLAYLGGGESGMASSTPYR